MRDVLASWLEANGKDDDDRAGLLRALNAAIDEQDRDFRLGPSYLMRADAETEAGLHRVWRYDVLPQLEEHYYGRLSRADVHQRFGLDALRRVVARSARDEFESPATETDELEG